jgi:endonuclease-3
MTKQKRARAIQKLLAAKYYQVVPPLNHSTAHELLFATILSAQSTDLRVNSVTSELFKRYKSIADYAAADLDELKQIIKTVGFYNTKAVNIKKAAAMLISDFRGQVPGTLSDLIKLPGVARKTANVVLAQWFHSFEGIAVDTHIIRVANRLGLTKHTEPVKIESDLMQLFPQQTWGDISLQIIFHGRETCHARSPQCSNCSLSDICPSAFKFSKPLGY